MRSYKEKYIPFTIATKHIQFLEMTLVGNMYESKKLFMLEITKLSRKRKCVDAIFYHMGKVSGHCCNNKIKTQFDG